VTNFEIVSPFEPAGDQPQAIADLCGASGKFAQSGAFGRYRLRQDLYNGQNSSNKASGQR